MCTVFPVSRYVPYDLYSDWYYPFGNTPPEDLAQHVASSPSNTTPFILSLGCGDLRSCLYTIWKQFDPLVGSRAYKGIHFLFNDRSSAVIGRNVLFIHVLTKNAERAPEQWIPSLWAIWYCHELLPHHYALLKEALSELLALSDSPESWKASGALTCGLCTLDPETLTKVRKVWEFWLRNSFGSVKSLDEKRRALRKSYGGASLDQKASDFVSSMVGAGQNKYSQEALSAMEKEFDEFLNKGTAFAEAVIGIAPSELNRLANPTFFEKESYTVHYHLIPYRCFFHSVQYTPEWIRHCGLSRDQASSVPMIVRSSAFVDAPFLANSIQQFTIWLTSAAKTLFSSTGVKVALRFQVSDAIEYCLILARESQKFDIVHSSNIMDYLEPPVLILATTPLLKDDGVLATSSFHAVGMNSVQEYLTTSFGISTELIPVLFAIQCIGHEGKYSSSTSMCPTSLFCKADILACVLLWKKCGAMPLKFDCLDEAPTIASALNDITKALLLPKHPLEYKSCKCSESAVLVYLSFISNLHCSVPIHTYQFWEGLCRLLRDNPELQPYVAHLQALTALHQLHFHLVYTQADCPLCNKSPLEGAILECELRVKPAPPQPSSQIFNSPIYMLLIHKQPTLDTTATTRELVKMSDHVLDSVSVKLIGTELLSLTTYVPSCVITPVSGYYISVFVYDHRFYDPDMKGIPAHCITLCLNDAFLSYNHKYTFPLPSKHSELFSTTLGTLTKHIGDEDGFCSDLTLNKESFHLLHDLNVKLITEQCSTTALILWIGKQNIHLYYPFSIDYPSCKIKIFKQKGLINIKIVRQAIQYHDERALFSVSASNMLCFCDLKTAMKSELLYFCGCSQFTPYEISCLQTTGSKHPPSLSVKATINTIFETSMQYYNLAEFSEESNAIQTVYALVAINKRLYDVEKQSPAVDLFFYVSSKGIPKNESTLPLWLGWAKSVNGLNETELVDLQTSKEGAEAIEKVLVHFARCTVQTYSHPHPTLERYGIAHMFTRAILYPLYSAVITSKDFTKTKNKPLLLHTNPSGKVVSNTAPAKKDHSDGCSSCGKKSQLMRCPCHIAAYCSKECQKRDWTTHKMICKKAT